MMLVTTQEEFHRDALGSTKRILLLTVSMACLSPECLARHYHLIDGWLLKASREGRIFSQFPISLTVYRILISIYGFDKRSILPVDIFVKHQATFAFNGNCEVSDVDWNGRGKVYSMTHLLFEIPIEKA